MHYNPLLETCINTFSYTISYNKGDTYEESCGNQSNIMHVVKFTARSPPPQDIKVTMNVLCILKMYVTK